MPVYKYKARTEDGVLVTGKIDAVDKTALVTRLRTNGMFLISMNVEDKRSKKKKKLKAMEISDFSRQIGTMLYSGVSLLRAVDIISKRDIKPGIRDIYQDIASNLKRGVPLWEAMKNQNGAFPELIINMFAAGEAGGKLDQAAMKMAHHYEMEHKLQSKIKSAMTYPLLLLIVSVLVILILFTFVLPNFFGIFEGVELPGITKFLMGISKTLINYWHYLIVGVVIFVLLFKFVLSLEKVRYEFDKLKLRIPIIGKLLKIIYTARFSRTLSSLYAGGIIMLNALTITRGTIGNHYIAGQFDNVISDVRRGNTLSESLAKVDGFDTKLASTVLIGEETGKLDEMLEATASSFEYESEEATARLTGIVEPLMIVIMAVVIGFIMVAVLLPIYDMYGNIS